MFEVRAIGAKGLGCVASTFIARGTCLIAEKPLLQLRSDQLNHHIYQTFRSLRPAQRTKLLDLSAHAAPGTSLALWGRSVWYAIRLFAGSRPFGFRNFTEARRLVEHARVLTVFRTNSFECDASSFALAVFHRISRLNHSCVPNTLGIWNEALGLFTVHATHDIHVDEELTLSYLHDEGEVRDERRERLRGYGFECQCPACDLETSFGRAGEMRRLEMREVLAEWAAKHTQGDIEGGEKSLEAEVAVIKGRLKVFMEHGAAGREVAELHLALARIYDKMANHEMALLHADKALDINGSGIGRSHPLYLQNRAFVSSLRARVVPG